MSKRSLWVSLILTVLASLGAVTIAQVSNTTPTLGLDLQGGFSVVLQAREVNGELPSEESVEKAKDIIRQRVDGLGVAEPEIVRQGRTVIVQLPGVTDRTKAESVVGCTAKLEFRPVLAVEPNPDAPEATTTTTKPDKKATTTTVPDEKTTTTTEADGSTTTTAADDGEGETGSGTAGLSAGEGALPSQFAPSTTTTTAPTTTTTAPPATTTTTPPSTTTTTVADDGSTAPTAATNGCNSGTGTATVSTTAPLAPGSEIVPSKDGTLLYTLGPVGFTGDALSKADAALQETWAVNVSVRGSKKSEANKAFNACFNGEATCPPQSGDGKGAIAIVLDGEVLSAPAVNGADLASDNFTISGDFDQAEAKELALVLRYGSLPVEFDQVALQQVSATLGTDSLRAGLIAGAVGIALVALYMLLYYRGLGLVVIGGLMVWGGFMYGMVCWLSANQGLALTLSGIIGIVVSVGTTVDSYVVYFERMKDEVRSGRSARSATDRGFNSAIRTIITADVASFLGAFLLWWLTVGPVRGFAFFLGMSVVLDLFVAYFFTRPVVALLSYNKRITDSKFMGLDSSRERAADQSGAPA
ncbi:protein translocase subunit SecD [Aquihabitans daechungensis]|uniref:protein translocase subunit SecD n=1 Tax=Aquihabitans daechungensis TaxID=1052257 RepID=UPI003BA1AB46